MPAIESHIQIFQVSPGKYECDLKDLKGTFKKSQISLMEKSSQAWLY